MKPSSLIRFADAKAAIPGPAGERALDLFQHGTLRIKLSRPLPPNRQTPHEQDELYVVAGGHGFLVHEGGRDFFERGDVMFVPAGSEHHVEDFSEDLSVWVIFFGPAGGEKE